MNWEIQEIVLTQHLATLDALFPVTFVIVTLAVVTFEVIHVDSVPVTLVMVVLIVVTFTVTFSQSVRVMTFNVTLVVIGEPGEAAEIADPAETYRNFQVNCIKND